MRFQRVATIDAEFYKLGLPGCVERVYFYLSARCATRFHVSEAEIVRTLRIEIKRVRASIEMIADMNLVKRWRFPRPKCTEYLITLSTEKGWGIGSRRTLSIGSRRTLLRGAGAPHNGEQAHPSPITNDNSAMRAGDSALFSLFQSHFRKWTFNRRPIGSHFHFTRPMVAKAIEVMRILNQEHGCTTDAAFIDFLDSCRDYLLPARDVLNHAKDPRAMSPVRWLNEWPEQIRLAGHFHDEKKRKITRMPKAGEKGC